MILCASNYVGYKITEFLINSNEKIDYLVLDKNNSGQFNEKIKSLFLSKFNKDQIFFHNEFVENNILDLLSNKKIELGILAWWPYILKGKAISIPKKGWLNFHPSYLPYNKGKDPNFWCLVENTKCGVTLHYIDENIDTGDIIIQEEVDTTWEDTGKSVYEKSLEAIIELFKNNFQLIKTNSLSSIKQKSNEGTFHHRKEIFEKIIIKLDEQYSGRELLNIIRAKMFSPYSNAYFIDNGKKYSVEVKIREIEE